MKKILKVIIFMSILSCKAQTIIKNIESEPPCERYDTNCYHKDINNNFNKFIGTWRYVNGNTVIVFIIKVQKKYRLSNNASYKDLLVGEYKYIENGTEKVNTLSNFDNSSISGYKHNISGGVHYYELPNYCAINSSKSEVKIRLILTSPTNSHIYGRLFIRHINSSSVEKLEVCINDSTTLSGNEDDRIEIPDGLYVFTKQ